MKKFKILTILTAFVAVLGAFSANAQSNEDWLTNTMFTSGKINVVIAVIAVVFVLLVIYLISIDRKLSRIENEKRKK